MVVIRKTNITARNSHRTTTHPSSCPHPSAGVAFAKALLSRIPKTIVPSLLLALLCSPSLVHFVACNQNNHNSYNSGNMASGSSAMAKAVSPMVQQSYKLLRKTRLSDDSFLLRYGLPEGRSILGKDPTLPTCIKVDFAVATEQDKDAKPISKSYSPVTHPNQPGYFDLVVKSYPYREGGGVGAYLCDMTVGDSIRASLKKERMMHGSSAVLGRGWKQVGLVAGGTGIAPLLQIARILLEDKTNWGDDDDDDNRPRIHLLFVNHTPSQILGVEAIETLAQEHPDHFFVTYSFTQDNHEEDPADVVGPDSVSRFTSGRGDVDMARAALPPPSSTCVSESDETETAAEPQSDTMIFVCGRDGFVAHWAGPVTRAPPKPDGKKGPKIQGPLLGVLAEAGFTAEQVFKY